jgi:hypothetical protein
MGSDPAGLTPPLKVVILALVARIQRAAHSKARKGVISSAAACRSTSNGAGIALLRSLPPAEPWVLATSARMTVEGDAACEDGAWGCKWPSQKDGTGSRTTRTHRVGEGGVAVRRSARRPAAGPARRPAVAGRQAKVVTGARATDAAPPPVRVPPGRVALRRLAMRAGRDSTLQGRWRWAAGRALVRWGRWPLPLGRPHQGEPASCAVDREQRHCAPQM